MDLPEDFENRVFEIFTSEEMSEPLIMVYRYLSFAVNAKCDKLMLNPTELCFIASGREVWKVPIVSENYLVRDFYRVCFLKVFERDAHVHKLFRYEFSDGGDLVIKVGQPTKNVKSQE
jgi:hypothetical protein